MKRKLDPRIIRTKSLIMKSFTKLSGEKRFNAITVKDITEEATVDRATFYYHFRDKYDLMEQILLEDLKVYVINPCLEYEHIDEITLKEVFLSLVNFHGLVFSHCSKSYQTFRFSIEKMVKNKMAEQFHRLLCKQNQLNDTELPQFPAIILSWGIYGLLNEWENNQSLDPEQLIIDAIPNLLAGISPAIH
ncbi:TetR/AcrR family transcriptional regulator [Amphibacillus sp. Q70]|uniref:TetR/AcrR family transcriptional regulator n=1 Tax=Amphibacillus sp. Q70 TaxID=3453416 RepID=UPI003F87B6EA